jgi:DNA polymerase I-like protein with 3'-5' exonuclease and polymerase domains
VLDWILDENRFAYGLKQRTKQTYGVDYDKENTGREVEKHPFDNVAHYVYMDVKYGWLLYQRHRPQIEAQGLEEIYNLELDILEIMAHMRLTGVHVDVPRIEELREDLTVRVEEAKRRVFIAAGKQFNLNSGPQKQKLLWGPKSEGGQGLRPWKLTGTGRTKRDFGKELTIQDYSTDAEALKSFPNNPLARELLSYAEVSKLLSTYIEGWLGVEEDILAKVKERPRLIFDERIYANFVQYAAATGRFGCRDPNLQNIPRSGTELGTLLRNAFCAPPGWKLITADYSQIEPRVMAHFIGRGLLYDGFMNGVDPYIVNASAALGKDPGDITKDERQKFGKVLFLAMGYGAQATTLSSSMDVSVSRAEQILERHEENMPEVYAYKDAVVIHARKQKPPHITTMLGRKRRLPELLYSGGKDAWKKRMAAERQAFNSLIQGSAADLMKLAMARTFCGLRDSGLAEKGAAINLTVHDEMVLSAPAHLAEQVAVVLQDGMTGPDIQKLLRVPLKADVQIGERWGELH